MKSVLSRPRRIFRGAILLKRVFIIVLLSDNHPYEHAQWSSWSRRSVGRLISITCPETNVFVSCSLFNRRSICLSCVCTVVDATFFCLELGGFTTVGRLLKVPLFLPPATINYLNSSREPPLSMLLYFLTANLSAVTLWPLGALSRCTGNLYSTPGFALLSNLYLRHFLVTMKYFYGRADVITSLFVPHLLGQSLQENKLYNTKDRVDVLQSMWGQFAWTGLGWCFQITIQLQGWAACIL